MIDPRVRIEDVDPDAFAHLNKVLSQRDRQGPNTLTVVHDNGRVVQATMPGITDDDIRDLEELGRQHGVDEVVLLDRRGLDDLSAQLVELARSTDDQGVLLSQTRDVYLGHWAVTVVPPPGPSRWPALREALNAVPDGAWLVAEADDFKLAAQVRGGRIVRITSYPPDGAHIAVTLRSTVDDVDAVLLADDPLGELRSLRDAGRVRFETQGEMAWLG